MSQSCTTHQTFLSMLISISTNGVIIGMKWIKNRNWGAGLVWLTKLGKVCATGFGSERQLHCTLDGHTNP